MILFNPSKSKAR